MRVSIAQLVGSNTVAFYPCAEQGYFAEERAWEVEVSNSVPRRGSGGAPNCQDRRGIRGTGGEFRVISSRDSVYARKECRRITASVDLSLLILQRILRRINPTQTFAQDRVHFTPSDTRDRLAHRAS